MRDPTDPTPGEHPGGEPAAAIPRGFFSWLGTGAWSVADQAFFSLAGFFLHVALARWLSKEDYGAFVLSFAVFLLLGAVQAALFSEPMLVFGERYYGRLSSGYLRTLLELYLGFALILAGLLAGCALVLSGAGLESLARSFWGLTLAAPAQLVLWMGRRACYGRYRLRLAATGSLLYLLALAPLLGVLAWNQALSLFSAYLAVAAAAATTGLWLFLCLGVARAPGPPGPATREVLRRHWRYGRWAMAGGALAWIPNQLYFLLLPSILQGAEGFAAAGSLRAAMNLINPVLQLAVPYQALLLPTIARLQRVGGSRRLLRRLLLAGAGATLLYCGVLWTFGRDLMGLLYGGRYDDASVLLPVLGLVPVVSSIAVVLGATLRAMERPDQLLAAQIAPSLATLTLGVLMTAAWGLQGSTLAILLSQVLLVIYLALVVRALWKKL